MAHFRFAFVALLSIACSSPPKPEATPPAPTSSASAAEVASGTPPAATTTTPSATAEDANAPSPPTSATATTTTASPGETDPQAALATAKKESKGTLLVFCAKWVASCGELAHVLTDASVKKPLDERFVVARVDVSNEEDPPTKERMKRYNVKGLPLMIVFDRKGKEVGREMNQIEAPKLVKLLDKAK